jgi:hypothetical protein
MSAVIANYVHAHTTLSVYKRVDDAVSRSGKQYIGAGVKLVEIDALAAVSDALEAVIDSTMGAVETCMRKLTKPRRARTRN